MRLLWATGLRIGEAIKLHWIDDGAIRPDPEGKFPMFAIKAIASKNGQDQRFLNSPEAHALLMETPPAARDVYVSNPTNRRSSYQIHDHDQRKNRKHLMSMLAVQEAAVGVEPTSDGFAIRCLRPLGYAAEGGNRIGWN